MCIIISGKLCPRRTVYKPYIIQHYRWFYYPDNYIMTENGPVVSYYMKLVYIMLLIALTTSWNTNT